MSDQTTRPARPRPDATPPGDDQHVDEGADGLGYTARPTDQEPEGEKAPAGGGDDATRK